MQPAAQRRFCPIITERPEALEVGLHSLDDESQTISPAVSIGRLSRLDAMQHQPMALANEGRQWPRPYNTATIAGSS